MVLWFDVDRQRFWFMVGLAKVPSALFCAPVKLADVPIPYYAIILLSYTRVYYNTYSCKRKESLVLYPTGGVCLGKTLNLAACDKSHRYLGYSDSFH